MMLTIAYLGPEKTNTHKAALSRFGRRNVKYVHAPTVDAVFPLVERRIAAYGVVPVENSLEGAVTHTLDRFIDFTDTPVTIQGELERPVRHYLITKRKTPLSRIKMIYSHPQALAQCNKWLNQRLPYADRREVDTTARAAWIVLYPGNKQLAAAIGPRDLGGKRARVREIHLGHKNVTRFLILGRGQPPRRKRNKTSILIALKDKPGALHDILVPFKKYRLNLTKIESRPSKRKAWEYIFLIDVEGHVADLRMTRALKTLKTRAARLQVLGSYPLGRVLLRRQ